MDKHFRVVVLSQTPNPQTVIYQALHQDYSEGFVHDDKPPSEEKCGEIAIERLLKGGRGHFGPLEHPQIVFNAGWFPHSTMQQIRTHRHVSMDVQSFRYTGDRLHDYGKRLNQVCTIHSGVEERIICDREDDGWGTSPWERELEELVYLRPVGSYSDRDGSKYEYTEAWRDEDLVYAAEALVRYAASVDAGMSPEHARGLIPFDVRQHWVLSCNMRSLMHLLTIRGKSDAQLECQQLCELMLPHFQVWAPQIYDWFMDKQWNKGKLAP